MKKMMLLYGCSCSDVKFQPIGAVLLSGMIKLTTEAKEVTSHSPRFCHN